MPRYTTKNVSAVVCTMNSISGIEQCLLSLQAAGVGQIIVVDADSTDGTQEVARKYADIVLGDPGLGLGNARNIGIAQSVELLVLNMGSDNIMPLGELEKMTSYLEAGSFQGVSAQTRIVGANYVAHGLNVWRKGRFPEGGRLIIGTPTLFDGALLRANPYAPDRKFSDDSELCERWSSYFQARFAISDAVCLEVGKSSWDEARIRARMYGVSDAEVFKQGSRSGWSVTRKTKSLLHPLRADFITPISRMRQPSEFKAIPFLGYFTAIRYQGWLNTKRKR